MADKSPDDTTIIMETLFDIRANTLLIIEPLREDDDGEEEEQADG